MPLTCKLCTRPSFRYCYIYDSQNEGYYAMKDGLFLIGESTIIEYYERMEYYNNISRRYKLK